MNTKPNNTSFKKGNSPWNKGLKNCYSKETIEKMRIIKKMNPTNYWLNKKRSIEDREKFSKSHIRLQIRNKNGMWKGDNVGYCALHTWLKRELGKAKECVFCETKGAKRYNWANIDHKYNRNLNDYISLCCSCHQIYDKNLMNILREKGGDNA